MNPNRRDSATSILIGTALLCLGVAAGLVLAAQFRAEPTEAVLNPQAEPRTAEPLAASDPEEAEAVRVFRECRESVVNVDTVIRLRSAVDYEVREQQTTSGSGFLWDDEGRVVTNYHVVRDAVANRRELRVMLADRTPYVATVIGTAPDYDLAVLKITAPKESLKPIRVGRSADLEVGRKTYAIGNPFGLSLTMTKGIISALDREIDSPGDRTISGAIQTDAPINPGNSGGPLLDRDGKLIGVNTSIASPSGGNVGIGFAIPVDTVNTVVTELIRTGRILRPDLGIKLFDQRRLRQAGVLTGVMVAIVEDGSPAAAAGIKGMVLDRRTNTAEHGDLIIALNGEKVRDNLDFTRRIANHAIGDVVKLTLERNDEQRTVEVKLRGV